MVIGSTDGEGGEESIDHLNWVVMASFWIHLTCHLLIHYCIAAARTILCKSSAQAVNGMPR